MELLKLTDGSVRIKKDHLELSIFAGDKKDMCMAFGFTKAAASCFRLVRYRESSNEEQYVVDEEQYSRTYWEEMEGDVSTFTKSCAETEKVLQRFYKAVRDGEGLPPQSEASHDPA